MEDKKSEAIIFLLLVCGVLFQAVVLGLTYASDSHIPLVSVFWTIVLTGLSFVQYRVWKKQ